MLSDEIILVTGANLRDRETILQGFGEDCHVIASQTLHDAMAHLDGSVNLIICESKSNQFDGLEFMRRWKLQKPETPFLMLVDQDDATSAVESLKNGAEDCIIRPIDVDDLRALAQQLMTSPKSGASQSKADANNGRKTNIDIPPDTSLEDLERAAVEQALIQHHGNRTHAARTLGISVRTLQRKLKAWGMPLMAVPPLHSNFLLGSSANTHSAGVSSH